MTILVQLLLISIALGAQCLFLVTYAVDSPFVYLFMWGFGAAVLCCFLLVGRMLFPTGFFDQFYERHPWLTWGLYLTGAITLPFPVAYGIFWVVFMTFYVV